MEAPSDANAHTGAVEIVGNSLGALFDGWRAIYDEIRDPPTDDLMGQLCVVELADHRVYIKRLRRAGAGKFHLESNSGSAIKNVRVTWAARVKNLVPR
jgi:hypothetical protein